MAEYTRTAPAVSGYRKLPPKQLLLQQTPGGTRSRCQKCNNHDRPFSQPNALAGLPPPSALTRLCFAPHEGVRITDALPQFMEGSALESHQ